MKVSLLTLGCRVNQSETDIIENSLLRRGCRIVGLDECPDYCIINTCTVTAKSDYQSRQLIRRALRTRAKVIVTGCYAHLMPEEIRKISTDIKIIKNNKKANIINIISNNIKGSCLTYFKRSRPYLKIQDGCNYSCSYCIIPKARGRSRSISVNDVLKRAIEIENAGYKEIVITGINLGSYGYDLYPKINLSKLLKLILKNTEIPRIRLSSIEPEAIDNNMIEILQDNRICKHIHVPLQSGDDKILRYMKRKYDVNRFTEKIEMVKKKIKDVNIGTDIIVGFPGEGKREFENTKKLFEYLPITYAHIFPFSKRPYTIASQMKMQNSNEIKKERFIELNSININKKVRYINLYIDKILDVIIEEKTSNSTYEGTSSNYLKVIIPIENCIKGTLIRVKIKGVLDNKLIGYPITNL